MRDFFRPAADGRLRVFSPLSLLIKDARLRLRLAYAMVLVLGLVFSGLIFLYSEDVLNASRRLVGAELPLLKQISVLKVEIGREESALYDYFATGDRERFERDFAASQRRSLGLIGEIERTTARPELLQHVRADHQKLELLAHDLMRALDDSSVILGESHPTLMRASLEVRDIHAELDALASLTEARMRDSANLTSETVRRMAQLGVVFSLGIFLVAVFIGRYINIYVRESAERRRLAVFAERNPNPVMRLALGGEIIYANAAALELAHDMDADSARVLLPEDLSERLAGLRGDSERYQVWEYERDARCFESGVHFLPDLGFHAYVMDVTERRVSEDKLVHQAYHNPLTGLPNRRMFQEVVEQTLRAPDHRGQRAAVYMLGLDRFKVVIDTLGHDVGDELLKAVAARLRGALDEARELALNASLYQFDGDVYAVLVPAIPSGQTAVLIAEKLIDGFKAPFYIADRELFVSASIGVAIFPEDGRDALTLLKNADSAMHGVKEQGGGGFRLYKPEMNAMAVHWLSLESYLRHAIERDELRLYYQPQVDIRSGRVVALEALLRWEHPARGILSPKEWVGLAEDSGLIVPISEWALRAACRQNREWRNRGVLQSIIAVNVSGRQFHQQDLPRLVEDVLADTGVPPDALELEITESVAMQDIERTVTMLRELKGMGVRLAIDDFGTGFSSLAYLKRFPIDKLKIDQSFVQHLTSDDTDAAITRAVVTLGHALKLKVGAEGVQSREQLARLRQYECDLAQGTLYSAPAPAHEIEQFLHAHPRLART